MSGNGWKRKLSKFPNLIRLTFFLFPGSVRSNPTKLDKFLRVFPQPGMEAHSFTAKRPSPSGLKIWCKTARKKDVVSNVTLSAILRAQLKKCGNKTSPIKSLNAPNCPKLPPEVDLDLTTFIKIYCHEADERRSYFARALDNSVISRLPKEDLKLWASTGLFRNIPSLKFCLKGLNGLEQYRAHS